MTDCIVEMNARQQLLERLSKLQVEIVELDGMMREVINSKVGARLTGNLLETANAIEAMLLVKP
jgi:hypothetical protein